MFFLHGLVEVGTFSCHRCRRPFQHGRSSRLWSAPFRMEPFSIHTPMCRKASLSASSWRLGLLEWSGSCACRLASRPKRGRPRDSPGVEHPILLRGVTLNRHGGRRVLADVLLDMAIAGWPSLDDDAAPCTGGAFPPASGWSAASAFLPTPSIHAVRWLGVNIAHTLGTLLGRSPQGNCSC